MENSLSRCRGSASLLLNACGTQIYQNGEGMLLRPRGSKNFHILYVVDGEARIFYNDGEFILTPGDFVLYPPSIRQEYAFDMTPSCSTFWIYFEGNDVLPILKELDIQFGVNKTDLSQTTLLSLKTLSSEFDLTRDTEKDTCTALLYHLLLCLSRDISESKNSNVPSDIRYIAKLIKNSPEKQRSAEELAGLCKLSVSRFEHKFSEHMGIPPLKYQISVKIDRAKTLLAYTGLAVSAISDMLGFCTPLYFSRVFTKNVGVSPSDYRKRFS